MNNTVLNVVAMVGGASLSLGLWAVVVKVWRYRGDKLSDVMPHPGFTEEDRLRYTGSS